MAASPAGAARPARTHGTDATGNKPHGFGKRSLKWRTRRRTRTGAREKVGEAYSALYEALEALESVGADFCTDLGYNGDTMDGYSLLAVVRDIEDSLEDM